LLGENATISATIVVRIVASVFRFAAAPSLALPPESDAATLEEINLLLQQARVDSVLAATAVLIAFLFREPLAEGLRVFQAHVSDRVIDGD